jgi:DNA-binding CsgD family transcriptional regulator
MDTTASVRVRGLRKSYGDTVAVDGVGLDIRHGEVFALLGPNGAGKTTTVARRDRAGPFGAARLVTRVRRPQRDSLSARKVKVLQLVARGMTNAEIGQQLFISEATVKAHLLRAFGKLGVSDRTAAVTTAIERGDIPPPGR